MNDGPERRGGEDRRENYYVLKTEPLWAKWLTPAAATIVIGGIVWGVQLNVAVNQMTSDISRLATYADQHDVKLDEMSANVLRTSLILEGLETRMRKVENRNEQ